MDFGSGVRQFLKSKTLAESAATVAATVTVGASFTPGLLPRKPIDQAIATGVAATFAHGITRITQTYIDSLSRKVAPGRDRDATESRNYLHTAASLTSIAGGIGLSKAFPAQRGEPVKRAAVRTGGLIFAGTGVTGLVVTAFRGTADAYERHSGSEKPAIATFASLGLAAAIAGSEIAWIRKQEPNSPPVAASLAQGAAIATGVTVISAVESVVADKVAGLIREHATGLSLLADPIGHSVGLGLLGLGVWSGLEYVLRGIDQGGTAIEAAYAKPPASPWVSGGNHSGIDWNTLSREGRRFVNMALTQDEITAVTEQPARDPIRVFVGLDSAPTVDARVAMAMSELDRLGAFDRSVLCLTSPTGSGYINYVMSETLEYATNGDCATVGMQYSVRPSFLSLDRVALGREQNRALMLSIYGRVIGMPKDKRPKIVLFGESLGAHTMQDAFMHEGTAGFDRSKVDRTLFVGTPAESKWAEQWRLDPERYDPNGEVVEISNQGEYEALDEEQRAKVRHVLLTHHDDPIPKFSAALIVQEPEWMKQGPDRTPALPEFVKWYPLTSFTSTLVDMKNAMDVKPGQFEGWGHDYRLDIPRLTLEAYGLDMPEDAYNRMYAALEKRELDWAQNRLVSEQFAQAQEAINRQLSSWQVQPVEAPRPMGTQPASPAGSVS